jgi:hypothetical protein
LVVRWGLEVIVARKKKDSGSKESGIEIGLLQRHSKVPSTDEFRSLYVSLYSGKPIGGDETLMAEAAREHDAEVPPIFFEEGFVDRRASSEPLVPLSIPTDKVMDEPVFVDEDVAVPMDEPVFVDEDATVLLEEPIDEPVAEVAGEPVDEAAWAEAAEEPPQDAPDLNATMAFDALDIPPEPVDEPDLVESAQEVPQDPPDLNATMSFDALDIPEPVPEEVADPNATQLMDALDDEFESEDDDEPETGTIAMGALTEEELAAAVAQQEQGGKKKKKRRHR